MWIKFTKFKKAEQGSVLAVKALKGEARSVALSISELDNENGVKKLLEELDKLYLKDKDTMGYDCWKKLSTYSRSTETPTIKLLCRISALEN